MGEKSKAVTQLYARELMSPDEFRGMIERNPNAVHVFTESGKEYTGQELLEKAKRLGAIVDVEEKHKTLTDILEEVKEDMCNNYCRYPFEPIPDGKDEDWLWTDEDSPCNNCPLNRL